ncbi:MULTISPECIES: PfkB family carbohydrate kinase [unclassified Luteococcus]|uniref:PfkB family carbohydrate kinase n=1 Tax=unclassified Luteococcus TaxID=2639923 RepID=UPI00313EBDBA
MARVIHTGQALVDVVVEIPALPRRGDNSMATSYARYAGGATNILVASARTGATSVHAGAHGKGPNGDLIRQAMAAEGIQVSSPIVDEIDTGICFVMIEPSAERTFVTTMGAERLISVESLNTCSPQPGDLVHVTGYSLAVRSTRRPLLEWLESLPHGVIVLLDPGAAFTTLPAPIRQRMLALTTVWTSNGDEAYQLTMERDMQLAAKEAAEVLPEGAIAIIRDGRDGCAVHVDGQTHLVPGYPQKPVDTNGAGDCHTGVLSAEYLLSGDWVESARRANAAAALKVTRRGPATAPTRAEVDAFLADWEAKH